MKVTFEQMKETIKKAFLQAGLSEKDAETTARIHTESSQDGVYSHGLNRVMGFLKEIEEKKIDPNAKIELVKSFSIVEQYDAHFGNGIINAKISMQRAIEIAKEKSIGLVALRNTSHWKRAASYSLQAIDEGMIGICWSNTNSNIPAWGSSSINLGNNPLSIALSYKDKPFVLDMAMSQYSFGKLQVEASKGNLLPFIGGLDKDGNETNDPKKLRESSRIYPIGYWKGSGLAIALELLATIISDGKNSTEIDKLGKDNCVGCSQIFIAINPKDFVDEDRYEEIIKSTIDRIKSGEKIEGFSTINYPGERMIKVREDSIKNGIEVDEEIWNLVKNYKFQDKERR